MNIGIELLCILAATLGGMGIAAIIVYAIPALIRKAVEKMNQKDIDVLRECASKIAHAIELQTETLHKIELQQMRLASTLAQLYYAIDMDNKERKEILNALYGKAVNNEERN